MAIARVNETATFTAPASTTVASSATSLTAGNVAFVAVRNGSGGSAYGATLADTAGNNFRPLTRLVHDGTEISLWVAWDALGHASNVVTATFNASVNASAIAVVQYSGLATQHNPYDTGGSNLSNANTVTSTAFTTSIADAVLIAVSTINTTGSTWTADTGFTTVVQDASNVLYVQESIVSAIQTAKTVVATANNAFGKQVQVVALTEDAGGGGGGGGEHSAVFIG